MSNVDISNEIIHAPQKKYFNAIDGLRLLASVNVVFFHLEYIGGLNDMGGSPGWLFRLIKGPAFHASLFFILGGFIFTTKFAHAQIENKFSNFSFLKKRFRELYPLHIITTLMMAAFYIIRRLDAGAIDIPKIANSIFMHLTFLWPFYPFDTLALNRPSWALAAMFFCYLLFKPLLKFCVSLKNRASVICWIIACFVLMFAWGYLYAALKPRVDLYQFFHVFAPVRFLEFALGALMAKFFMLKKNDVRSHTPSRHHAIFCDAAMIVSIIAIFLNLSPQMRDNSVSKWFSYHVYMAPIYMVMIYAMAVERGFFARVFSLSIIRKLGRTSFYPYLLHIPLITVVTMFCEDVLGYRKFLHSPINVLIFVALLYGGSYFYVYGVKKKK